MLKVQAQLQNGKTLEALNQELGIMATHHDVLPLVILNYNQIESPKTHSIVRECRGLVLNKEDWSIVAKSMDRFFNWGEVADEMPLFNWDKAQALEKVDGSLCLFYHFNGEWHVNTCGSFAGGSMFNTEWQAKYHKMPQDFTWKQGILSALGIKDLAELNLDPALTYVGEFCSLWNKVVREYPQPCVYLLSCFAGEEEVGPRPCPFRNVESYSLRSVEEIQNFVQTHPEVTFEGVVVKDDANRRWKIKNAKYLALSRLKGNNDHWNPKYLLPFILANEGDELLTYFPESEMVYRQCKAKVDAAFIELQTVWEQHNKITVQKEFALAIVGKTPFSSVLFQIRKQLGNRQTLADLKKAWTESTDTILKNLF